MNKSRRDFNKMVALSPFIFTGALSKRKIIFPYKGIFTNNETAYNYRMENGIIYTIPLYPNKYDYIEDIYSLVLSSATMSIRTKKPIMEYENRYELKREDRDYLKHIKCHSVYKNLLYSNEPNLVIVFNRKKNLIGFLSKCSDSYMLI